MKTNYSLRPLYLLLQEKGTQKTFVLNISLILCNSIFLFKFQKQMKFDCTDLQTVPYLGQGE